MLQEVTTRSSDSAEVKPADSKESKSDGHGRKDRDRDRSKKRSWYSNILYPTYKSRSDNFKRIFKDVPDEERLVVGLYIIFTINKLFYFYFCK